MLEQRNSAISKVAIHYKKAPCRIQVFCSSYQCDSSHIGTTTICLEKRLTFLVQFLTPS